jgi:hypothetical protein
MAIKLWRGGASGATDDASVAANWSPSGVPTTGDDVYFDSNSNGYDVQAGLSGSGSLESVALSSIHFLDTFTRLVGTETSPLACDADNVYIHEATGSPSAAGSRRINLDLGSNQANVVVYGSASTTADVGLPQVRIIGTNASNTLYATGNASVGVAVGDATEVATFASINTARDANGNAPTIQLGAGCTLTTIEAGAGVTINQGANVTTAVVSGTYRAQGTATHGTLEVRDGGVCRYNSTGTITTLEVHGGGAMDFSGDPQPKTVTNCVLSQGASLHLNNGNPLSITFTNDIDLDKCGVGDVTLTTWPDITVGLSAI